MRTVFYIAFKNKQLSIGLRGKIVGRLTYGRQAPRSLSDLPEKEIVASQHLPEIAAPLHTLNQPERTLY